MYDIYTKFKTTSILTLGAICLMVTTAGLAGPGKPGVNPIKEGGNILEIAATVNGLGIENEDEMVGEFAYLLGAVGCLSAQDQETVIGLLTGSDKYTIFAPTNQAFRNLQTALGVVETSPEASCAVDTLFGSGTLFSVLAYHLTDGRRFSNSVFNKKNPKSIEMLSGDSITTLPNLTIMDGAFQIVEPVPSLININASNGVIHVISTVMLPFAP